MRWTSDALRSDEALLADFARGDARAAEALTRRLAPRVLAHAARMLGDRAEAEDVTQEALLRLWHAAEEWETGAAKVSTWLYRVTANLCIDRIRRRRPQAPETAAAEIPDAAPGAVARMTDAARADALQAALARLPDRQRQAVVLRHIEGLGNPEIAAIMDIGVEAVESLVARGKRALAADLAPRKDALGYGGEDWDDRP